MKRNKKLEEELSDSRESAERTFRNHVDQLNSKLKEVNKKIESYEQMQSEVEVLRSKNSSLMRTNAEMKIALEEAEVSALEMQKYKSKCGSLREEVEFLQKQKAELIQGQQNQRWQADNIYQQEIGELKQRIQKLVTQLGQSESNLIESETKRIELRKQLDSSKGSSANV